MKKIVKKQGNSLLIRFTSDETKILDLEVGDQIDIEVCNLTKVKKEKRK